MAYTTQYPWPLPLDQIRVMVEEEFRVQSAYVDEGVPCFVLVKGPTKEPFLRLVAKMKGQSLVPTLKEEKRTLILRVLIKVPPPRSNIYINVGLFFATVATVLWYAYMFVGNPILALHLMPNMNTFVLTAGTATCVIAIIGLHEVGHKTVCDVRQIEATMPYFIPVPPFLPVGVMGTLGAVIMQKEPPVNRDAMFDLGSSGPVIGFLVTLAVAIAGLRMSFVVDVSTVAAWSEMYPGAMGTIPVPLLFDLLGRLLRADLEAGKVLIFSPIATVGWFGMLLTFLNLMPIWQFDGGWVSRAVFGPRLHRWISYVGIAVMIIIGFWPMALLALLGMSRAATIAPLDDVSALTVARKVFSVVLLAIIVLCAINLPYF